MSTICIGEEEMILACELVSHRQEQLLNNQDNIIRSTIKANQASGMQSCGYELNNSENIDYLTLLYEHEQMKVFYEMQIVELARRQSELDLLQDKVSILLSALVALKSQEETKLTEKVNELKKDKDLMNREMTDKNNSNRKLEVKLDEMNYKVKELEEQNKKLILEVSILTEKETIRQISVSQEDLLLLEQDSNTSLNENSPSPLTDQCVDETICIQESSEYATTGKSKKTRLLGRKSKSDSTKSKEKEKSIKRKLMGRKTK